MRVVLGNVLVVLVCLGHLSASGQGAGQSTKAQGGKAAADAVKPAASRTAIPTKFQPTEARLKRGRYLVEGVAHCVMCHSPQDWNSRWIGPKPGLKGSGGLMEDELAPFKVYAPNITPDSDTGSGAWTDEQFERALRQGIGHDGRKLFNLMPYESFRKLSDEDLASVVVYIRSLAPVRQQQPKTQLPPPLLASLPSLGPVPGPVAAPDRRDPVKYGEYLVTIGNCRACHDTFDDQFQPVPGMVFAGGTRLKGPWGDVHSANLTPDPSGISYYDEKLFIRTIRTGHVGARKLNPIMPTAYFRRMTDQDLKAIFAYLRTLKPVQHRVDNTEPPTPCRICRGRHGGGELN